MPLLGLSRREKRCPDKINRCDRKIPVGLSLRRSSYYSVPKPYHHPRISYIINAVNEIAKKISVFTPIIHIPRLIRNDLTYVDELVIVASTPGDLAILLSAPTGSHILGK